MDKNVKLLDLTFEPYISEQIVQEKVKAVAERLNADYAGKSNVLLIGVLNGAFVFTADLVRYLNFDCEVDFIRVSSYKGTQSIGSIELNLHLKYEVKGRDVILIDDILDTGLTLHELRKYFLNLQCASVEVCVFCRKPTCVKHDIDAKYVGLDLPSPEFIVGYGLDYNEKGRNLPSIYKKCG